MDTTTIVLSCIMLTIMAFIMLPSIIKLNQGKMLRNTAIWLAIICALALFYRVARPDLNMSLPRYIHANTPNASTNDPENQSDTPQSDTTEQNNQNNSSDETQTEKNDLEKNDKVRGLSDGYEPPAD